MRDEHVFDRPGQSAIERDARPTIRVAESWSNQRRKWERWGTGGLFLMALAIPSFRETSDYDWLKMGDLAVTLRQRSRQSRHQAYDSVALDEMPDHLIKAVLPTERLFDDASHILTVQDRPPGSLGAFDVDKDGASPLTAARDSQSPTVSRGD